jgi:Histidine kinase
VSGRLDDGVDWRMALGGLPRRRFSAAELARAGADVPPSRPLVAAALANLLLPLISGLVALHGRAEWPLLIVLMLFAFGIGAGLWAAWRNPGARAVQLAYWGLPMALGVALALRARVADGTVVALAAVFVVLGGLALWFLTLYRQQFIAGRLRERDEQDRALALARQLATAQIQPHFLFNTLAALQHWVHSHDTRAAPLLDALTGFLRATLPLFDRERLTLGEELVAVRQYLEVMRLRLGERLRFALDIDAAAHTAALPPGLLLTLVENAVEHGVQPQLVGGAVMLQARVDAGKAIVEVRDDGAGLAPDARDGVGLANSRARLAQAFGEGATLVLGPGIGGGCVARLVLPLHDNAPP